jgi:hypothetical protein
MKLLACSIVAMCSFLLVDQVQAQSGKVLLLDGSTAYMSVADHADIDVDPGENITITCWVQTTSVINNGRIIAKRTAPSGSNLGYEFYSNSTGYFATNLRHSGSNVAPNTFSTAKINDNTWHHLAMVVDATGTKTVKNYIDGVLVGTGPNGTNTFAGTETFANAVALLIGKANDNTLYWPGKIDDVRFWSKAFTATEVQADRSMIVNGPVTNLLAAWNFENVTGTDVPDVSGNNHPGTLSGNAAVVNLVSDMQYASTALYQTELPVGKGETNQRILAVNVITSGVNNAIALTSLSCTLNGTTDLADLSQIKIYYTGNSNRFTTAVLFATVAAGTGTITANGTQTLAEGNNYFWIAVDVGQNAVEGNVIDATCESITVGGTTYTPAVKTVAGTRTILLAHKLLFSGGDAGAANYRIPAITTAKDGSLIVAVDKRINGAGDLPADIDVVIRRSTDNGQTWSTAVTIADLGGAGASDPALVVDKASGKIICLFATDKGLFGSTATDPIRIRMCTSMDHGVTWSAPVDITNQLYGAGCSNPVTKNWAAAWVASGAAHQLRNGRIVAAVGVRQTSGNQIDNFMIYSDDAGVTWQPSTGMAEQNGDEAKIVELNNGNLLMSIRNPGVRRMNVSADKGLTWGTAYNQTDLIEPNCDGDIIRYTSTLDGYDKNRLLHTIPSNSSSRKNVSVLISYDEGATWPVNKTIYPGASAYSSITILPDGTLGMFYENGEYETYQMYFVRFSLKWLTNNTDNYTPAVTTAVTNRLNDERVNVFPNPAGSFVRINKAGYRQVKIALVNSTGQQYPVTMNHYTDYVTVDTRQVPAGVYWLQVFTMDKQIAVRRLIIQ